MYENERPSLKHFVYVILATAILILFSWIAYYKFHWFQ